MTVQELVGRFPEIPAELHGEPLLAAFAVAFEDQLEIARKPSACAVEHDADNHFYLRLIGPIDIYRYGLYDRERVLEEIGKLVDGHRADPGGFANGLLPEQFARQEVKGPGCG